MNLTPPPTSAQPRVTVGAPVTTGNDDLQALLAQAQAARNASNWSLAVGLFQRAVQIAPAAHIYHNLALCYLGAGKAQAALQHASRAIQMQPALWQSRIILAKAQKQLGQPEQAYYNFIQVLHSDACNGPSLLGLADLMMNEFGDPLTAKRLVAPLAHRPEYGRDVELTVLMASLYDRDTSATQLARQVMDFSRRTLRLPHFSHNNLAPRASRSAEQRPRVALMSPLLCVSPVYFLTIAGFRHIAQGCDVLVFNRGQQQDWATNQFRALASEWHEVQYLSATQLAHTLYAADIDVLYDLGGWMDPIGLQALSTKPALQQFKWVGGQSITTGLDNFDGWIGDPWQSPLHLQHLYSEPLMNVQSGYAIYTPPPYMPKPAQRKSEVPAIFANPAKVSRAFLHSLRAMPGKKCFIHRQYQYARVRARIEEVLGHTNVEYVCPNSHEEALDALNTHAVMIDTFPYGGGLTAREAHALGTRVHAQVGELFCERHSAGLYA
ncbi:MAG: hypothetical protein IT497_05855 [Ottowia sp.]|nr:hypothetical protein [Ottowia sp.]